MTSSTDAMSQTEYNSSSLCWCIGVFMERLHTNRQHCWSSASAVRQSAEVDRSTLSSEQFRLSVFCCWGPVDLEFATWKSSWPSTEASAEDILFRKILTRCTQRIRDLLIMCYINLHFTYLLKQLCVSTVTFQQEKACHYRWLSAVLGSEPDQDVSASEADVSAVTAMWSCLLQTVHCLTQQTSPHHNHVSLQHFALSLLLQRSTKLLLLRPGPTSINTQK